MNILEKTAAYILFWIICALVLINLGFIFGIKITAWSLPLSYVIYLEGIALYKLFKKHLIFTKGNIFLVLLIPVIFLIATFYFGKTYDSSFDGQDYHSGAVIELVNGWNPWKDIVLPFKLPDAMSYVIGYPKSLWMLQAGIYALTNNLNSATVTNLLVLIISTIFVCGALLRLKISRTWTLLITAMIVFEPNFLQQYFTYMSDGFSYQVMLIAISSLVILISEKDKQWPLATFLSSLILLAGVKFSNLPILGLLGIISLIYLSRIVFKQPRLILQLEIFFIIGCIVLWVPYVKNFIYYGTPLYPSNQSYAQRDLVLQNIPINLRGNNRLKLFFYGIYSEGQQAGAFNSPSNIAKLKIPFTTSLKEISVTNDFNGRVGSEGVMFSGLFTISILLYLLFILKYKSFINNRRQILVLTLAVLVIIISSLIEPTPNVLRYELVIYLMPICILIILISSKSYQNTYLTRILSIAFAIIISLNIVLKFVPSLYARDHEMKAENYLLGSMKDSGKIYEVHTDSFYSSYVLLRQHDVSFKQSDKLKCKSPHSMWIMFNTFYCP